MQRKASGEPLLDRTVAATIARHGVDGAGRQLPHHDRIQALFGRHDAGPTITPPRPGIDIANYCTMSKDLTKYLEEEGDYSSRELVDAVLWCVGAVVVMARIV